MNYLGETGQVDEDDGDRFRLLIESITDCAIYMLDPHGRVTSWNPGAKRLKGYRPDEIIGQHFSRFYTDEDQALGLPAKALKSAVDEGRFENEGWRVRKDGSRFWALVLIDPIRNSANKIVGFAKITRDITERRNAQLALDEARQELFQSQKLDAIGQLTGGVAHDFNNLLMAILGSLELLRKRLSAEDSKATVLLENAVQGAQRGAALTQRLLAFARKQELALEGVDIPALVTGMSGLLYRLIGPEIKLRSQFSRHLPPATTDANQLEMALLNLVTNARDAMPDGGEITLEASAVTLGTDSAVDLPAGQYVKLAVIDDGYGMDDDMLARATEPFFTTKGVGKGTGLGLSMVHGLAEQSGGRLTLAREPGRGVRVELWFPQAQAVAEKEQPLDEHADHSTRQLDVLVVDDDGLVLMNTTAMLEDLGHRVISAGSGAEALKALGSHAVDLVITDYAMPRMNGLELAHKIEARWPGLNVVLASGYAEMPSIPGSTRRPRIAKPYSQADLTRLLHRLFGSEPIPEPQAQQVRRAHDGGGAIADTNMADRVRNLRAAQLGAEAFVPIAELLPVMLWVGDEQGRCVYLNKAQREFWGVDEASLSSFGWNSTLIAEDAESLFEVFRIGMSQRQPFTAQARYRRADGEIRILHTKAEPRFGPNDEFLGMVGVNLDVTDD